MTISLIVVGAGVRGTAYARYAAHAGARIVGVAEPDPVRRARFALEFGVSSSLESWEQLAAEPRLADAAIIATQDRMHADPAVLLAGQGYHLLLEKPMAPTEDEATRIADAAAAAGVHVAVCHVLRYTPYTTVLKGLLDAGRIGRLVSIQHLEPVGWWHQAHSFVRGPWRSAEASSPMLLAKSCHDIDWLLYLAAHPVRRLSSFGGLSHFRPDQRPAGAANRCLDCAVEPDCPYSATRLYLGCLDDPAKHFWPLSMLTNDISPAGVLTALREGPYGECVYNGHNDVVDHQVVSMELTDGATISFTMTAFTPFEARKTRLFGTHGYISGNGATLRVVDFRTGTEETITVRTDTGADHSDGDAALVTTFVTALSDNDPSLLRSDAATSLASHRVVWAAEQARLSGSVVSL